MCDRAILTAFSTASAPELNSAERLSWSPGVSAVELLAHGDVALVRRDHEAGVGERRDLLLHVARRRRRALLPTLVDGDAGAEVDERVAVGVDEDAAAGRGAKTGRCWARRARRRPPAARAAPASAGRAARDHAALLRQVGAPVPAAVLVIRCSRVGHDVLDPGVLLEAVEREVMPVAGVLVAAVRHLGDERAVGVDPHTAEVEPLGHPHGAPVVARPDRRRQAVWHVVGPPDGLVLVAEPLNGDDRAEDLVLHDVVALIQPGHDGGLEEEAERSPPAAAARVHGRVSGSLSMKPVDPTELTGVVQRAEVGGRVARRPARASRRPSRSTRRRRHRAPAGRPARGWQRCSPDRRCSSRPRRWQRQPRPRRHRRRRRPAPCRRARGGPS